MVMILLERKNPCDMFDIRLAVYGYQPSFAYTFTGSTQYRLCSNG